MKRPSEYTFAAVFEKEADGRYSVSFPQLEGCFTEDVYKRQTFLKGLAPDAIKAECLLPVFVDKLMHEGELTVPMLTTDAVWFGVTYKEDKPFVQAELRKLHESGVYPASLHE